MLNKIIQAKVATIMMSFAFVSTLFGNNATNTNNNMISNNFHTVGSPFDPFRGAWGGPIDPWSQAAFGFRDGEIEDPGTNTYRCMHHQGPCPCSNEDPISSEGSPTIWIQGTISSRVWNCDSGAHYHQRVDR